MDEAKAEAEQERNKIVAQAQADRRNVSALREELRKQVAMLAIAGAEKIIERSVDEALTATSLINWSLNCKEGRG